MITGQASASPTTFLKEMPGPYPGRSLTRELGGQYPELLQESKDPQKTNKKPTHPLESWWGSLILNTQWNPTVQADAKSCEENMGLRHRGANATKIENTLCSGILNHEMKSRF